MSEIVERLQAANEWMRAPDWNDNLDDLELVSWLNRRPAGGFQAAIDEITRLTAEVAEYEATFDTAWEADMRGVRMWREAHPGNDMVLPDRANFTAWILTEIMRLRSLTVAQETLIREAEAANEKLRAALRECELELNACYRMGYPGDHPYSQKKLAQAMASNPATVALKETSNDSQDSG